MGPCGERTGSTTPSVHRTAPVRPTAEVRLRRAPFGRKRQRATLTVRAPTHGRRIGSKSWYGLRTPLHRWSDRRVIGGRRVSREAHMQNGYSFALISSRKHVRRAREQVARQAWVSCVQVPAPQFASWNRCRSDSPSRHGLGSRSHAALGPLPLCHSDPYQPCRAGRGR